MGSTVCRSFAGIETMKNLDFNRFQGGWYTQFYKRGSDLQGTCPVTWFEPRPAVKSTIGKLATIPNFNEY